MLALMRLLGLEPSPAVKARREEATERFERQLSTRSVTDASRLNNVSQRRLDRALKAARQESESQTRHH